MLFLPRAVDHSFVDKKFAFTPPPPPLPPCALNSDDEYSISTLSLCGTFRWHFASHWLNGVEEDGTEKANSWNAIGKISFEIRIIRNGIDVGLGRSIEFRGETHSIELISTKSFTGRYLLALFGMLLLFSSTHKQFEKLKKNVNPSEIIYYTQEE